EQTVREGPPGARGTQAEQGGRADARADRDAGGAEPRAERGGSCSHGYDDARTGRRLIVGITVVDHLHRITSDLFEAGNRRQCAASEAGTLAQGNPIRAPAI